MINLLLTILGPCKRNIVADSVMNISGRVRLKLASSIWLFKFGSVATVANVVDFSEMPDIIRPAPIRAVKANNEILPHVSSFGK